MKKNVTGSLLVFIFLFTVSKGQILERYGLKTGPTFSKQDWEYPAVDFKDEFDNRTGFAIGAFAEIIRIGAIGIQSELNYIQRGSKMFDVTGVDSPDLIGTIKNRTDYLSLALLAKYNLKMPLISPYVLLGPRLDFYLDFDIDEIVHEVYAETFENFKDQIYGGTIGVGAEVNVLPVDLFAEFRYDFDFNKAFEDDYIDISSKSFYFTVGLFLDSLFEE
ncbi:MAG: porin family protein [Ignavibacteria bacterium]|jgi:hypothetical protein